jgi:peroxiredoxin
MENIDLSEIITDQGILLSDLSHESPVLLIFLRTFGCAFCREAMDELSKKKNYYHSKGIKMVFVYLSDPKEGRKYFKKFNLADQLTISDPHAALYKRFGLVRASANQLLGLSALIRGVQVGVIQGYGFNFLMGDGFQMPGVFVLHKNQIESSFVHKSISDKPNYDKLISCCELITEE